MRCSVSSISLAYSDGVGNSACHTVVVWFAPHRISNDGCTCQSTQVTEVVTVKGQTKTTPKRRYRTVEEERRIVEETLVEGASVARVARAHGVNANQVFAWRKLYLAGRLNGNRAIQLLPVRVSKSSLSLATTHPRIGSNRTTELSKIEAQATHRNRPGGPGTDRSRVCSQP